MGGLKKFFYFFILFINFLNLLQKTCIYFATKNKRDFILKGESDI